MRVSTPQPAYKMYVFERGWRIERYIGKYFMGRTHAIKDWWFDRGALAEDLSWKMHILPVVYLTGIIKIGCQLAGLVQYVLGIELCAIFTCLALCLLTIGMVLGWLTIAVCTLGNIVYARVHRVFFRCPNCHKNMPLPTYICSTCQIEHTRLWPSIYGIFWHTCITCKTRLPTLSALGRRQLACICPHCHYTLSNDIGTARTVHLPIVGGPAAGKTTYLLLALQQLTTSYAQYRHEEITLTDSQQEENLQEQLQLLRTGRPVPATKELVPRAYTLKIKARHAHTPQLAYIYDAAGEIFNTNRTTSLQAYYQYVDGITFIIDAQPLLISLTTTSTQEEQNRAAHTAILTVMQVYERMIQMLEISLGMNKRGRYTQPIAIILSKVDTPALLKIIGPAAALQLCLREPSIQNETEAIHLLVRTFLTTHGLDHFVRDLEINFANIRYFSTSALLPPAESPESGAGQQVVRVIEPFTWLFTQTRISNKHS